MRADSRLGNGTWPAQRYVFQTNQTQVCHLPRNLRGHAAWTQGDGVSSEGQGAGLEAPPRHVSSGLIPGLGGTGRGRTLFCQAVMSLLSARTIFFLLQNQRTQGFGAFFKISLPSVEQFIEKDGQDAGEEKQLKKRRIK